jgi:hypothetical protein
VVQREESNERVEVVGGGWIYCIVESLPKAEIQVAEQLIARTMGQFVKVESKEVTVISRGIFDVVDVDR